MSEPVLTTRGLRRHYGTGATRFEALKGIDFDIAEGESVAIVGKSGSGKSTLMHLLALLHVPSAGEVQVSGRDARALSARELNVLRNRTFGFVFQQFFLTPGASVLDNVTLPLTIGRVRSGDRRARALAVLERLELADKAKAKTVTLSGGQKQRTVIARALVNDPRVIFADEPTGNLDSATGAVVEDLLFELNREQGITLVIVTHDDDLAARADRRIAIAIGSVISAVLADGLLVGLAGLQILAFAPLSVLGVLLLVMAIALVAGTLPAYRAARQSPIDALRYE